MLRVETSNLQSPKRTPRSRRLLPSPPLAARRPPSIARETIVPPPAESERDSFEAIIPTEPRNRKPNERWSVRLELGDDEIAKLYGQGMARGAVVWRKGMVEWRPLLITPELSGLLRRTRVTLDDAPAPPRLPAPPAVPTLELSVPPAPKPARDVLPPELAQLPVTPTTVAPIAMDVQTPSKPRRPLDLAAVAVAAFAVAWIGHAALTSRASSVAALPPATQMPLPAAPACEPRATPSSATPSSSIPTVAITDLPLAGTVAANASGSGSGSIGSNRGHAERSVSGNGPTRAELVAALSQVARASSSCGERSGPVRVVMSFGPSGVARSIQVSGQDLPAGTRSCIIGAAARARVPAFSGSPVTVGKTL